MFRLRALAVVLVVALFAVMVPMAGGMVPMAGAQELDDTRPGRASVLRRISPVSELDERPEERPSVDLGEFSLAELLPESELFHPDVMRHVRLELGSSAPIAVEIATSLVEFEEATQRRLQAFDLRGTLLSERTSQVDVVAANAQVLEEAEEELAEAEVFIGEFALATFVGSAELDIDPLQTDVNVSPFPELSASAEDVLTDRLFDARADVAAARTALVESEDHLSTIGEQIAQTQRRLELATLDQAAAYERVHEQRPQLEDSIAQRQVSGTDLTGVVLDAYYNAQVLMAERRPGCDVSWDQLAGIGLIETRHGTFGGNVVGADGVTSGRILGPELNGDPFAAIADTDGGALDGNPIWDHAVGPMQFIPGSWKLYALDGDADGVQDPHNIYDAAFSAAEHLCRSISQLQDEGNFTVALFGYNRSEQYGLDVKAARNRYDAAIEL